MSTQICTSRADHLTLNERALSWFAHRLQVFTGTGVDHTAVSEISQKPHTASPLPSPPSTTGAAAAMEAGGEEFAIGVVISAKTTLGEEFEGQIVSFDRPSNLLVIHILPKSLSP
jgi:hypothetical protein